MRSALACIVLATIWIVFGLTLGLIAAAEVVLVPIEFFLPIAFLAVLLSAGLLASIRWRSIWRIVFAPTVRIPGWVWVGVLTTAVGVMIFSTIRPLSVSNVIWMGVICVAGSYLPSLSAFYQPFRRFDAWPYWIVACVVAALAILVVGVAVVEPGSPITFVFFVALLLFTFHVCFVIPVALYQSHQTIDGYQSEEMPPVSVLIPAYNEEGFVGDCIESVLASTYPNVDVVVIDDGSTDRTYEEAASYREEGVRVFRRTNGGKHAALNFGLQCSSSPIVVTVDADSHPKPTAISKMVCQLQSNDDLGGLSAPVLVANNGTLIAALQRIEYAISNTNRRAYSVFGAVPVVPGCLGVYRREALEDVWGYDPDTDTEDFDLTVKLLKHGWAVRHGTGVVETVVPEDWRTLWRQRLRWYRGGTETIYKHRSVLLDPSHGYLHALSLPTRLVSHAFGPFGSFIILGAVIWGFLVGPTAYVAMLCVLFLLLTGLIALFTIVIEREPIRSVIYAPLLFIGYKHFIDCSIAVGSIRAFVGDNEW